MPVPRERIFDELSDAVLEMDEERTVSLAEEVVRRRLDAYQAIDLGLVDGMKRAGDLFDREEYFIPELLLCADAMYSGLAVLKPHLKYEKTREKCRIVIGVVEGDTHDIGKNLVKTMLEVSGFEVFDLGQDTQPIHFVNQAAEVGAQIIALSTLMTTTMDGMAQVIRYLNEKKIRERHRVIVGGGPISAGFAQRIGADGYAATASEAVTLVKRLLGGNAP